MKAAASIPESSVVRATLRALVRPTRLAPILIVCLTMLVAQGRYSRDRFALVLGVIMCLSFVFVAPVTWRVLFPEGLRLRRGGGSAVRLALYAIMGIAVMMTLGVAVPKLTGMGGSFLTDRYSLAVCAALYLVGGWGLGRDIGMEASLEREKRRAAALAREAELAQLLALRSHLDPHFLFNTLNAIAEWCRQDPEVAERAVLQLSSMLRTVLAGVKAPSWPLEKELELVRTLFSLHLMRDPGLFTLEWSVDEAVLQTPVPPMLLLPIAENAVKHGPAAGHRGVLRFEAVREGENVRVRVTNPGVFKGPRPGSDGLPTLQKRLAVAYGGRATFDIQTTDGGATTAQLALSADGPDAGVTT